MARASSASAVQSGVPGPSGTHSRARQQFAATSVEALLARERRAQLGVQPARDGGEQLRCILSILHARHGTLAPCGGAPGSCDSLSGADDLVDGVVIAREVLLVLMLAVLLVGYLAVRDADAGDEAPAPRPAE
jgi:hypothetical protein